MQALRWAAVPRRWRCWASGGRPRPKFSYGPRRPQGPLPRTPWTVRGPPPGQEVPWHLQRPPPLREQLPELDVVTYEGKMHPVPWLARPFPQRWERGWRDPWHDPKPRLEDLPAYKARPCFLFHQRCSLLEGVKQALWLTKTKLISGLPPPILNIMNDTANQLENQDERVNCAISHARFWGTSEEEIPEKTYSPVLLEDLLHLCRTMTAKYPSLANRMMAQDYRITATWERESALLQVHGINGKILNVMNPLESIASKDEILATESHILETFYPIAPTIDLEEVNVYETTNDTGFREHYPYPHPHTIYFARCDSYLKMEPEQLRAKMLMFAFGNAVAKAKILYGDEPQVLEKPIVVQSVGTDGRCFHFLVFQLNTTDLDSSQGIKNIAWLDADQLLYEDARSQPEIKKKVVVVPAGIHGYQPETFKKFLAFYLHGVV